MLLADLLTLRQLNLPVKLVLGAARMLLISRSQ